MATEIFGKACVRPQGHIHGVMKTISLSFRLETFQFRIAWEKNATEKTQLNLEPASRTTGAGTVIVLRVELFNLQGPPSRNRDNKKKKVVGEIVKV